MPIRRPPTTFSDEISAADLAANSVGASELADNAVDTAAIADDAVTNAKVGASAIGATELASNAVTTAKITDANITAAKVASSAITKEKLAAEAIEVKPHIKPGVLYPSLNDKQIDGVTAMAASTTGPAGSTVASSKWGTVQSDGRMYYFTGIKGSKPINDPRIGAHFGVQRHKFKSLQILLDETAHHKLNVYSLDGREWCRAVSVAAESLPATEKINVVNNSFGEYLAMNNDGVYIEITGYFNDIHWIGFSSATRKVRYTLDEGSEVGTDFGHSSIVSPYDTARYTDNGSVSKFGINTHLGIHTIKIRRNAGDAIFANGFEFVAQDRFTDATCDYNNDPTITHDASTRIVAGMTVSGTGIPANATVSSVTSTTAFELSASTTGGAVTNGTLTFGEKSIDIPPQNVVSYGKKFAVSRAAHHYDPFVTMSYGGSGINASTLGGLIDTATSLGMENWKAGGSNYHRPWNGGRVVKWIASDGTIKTSVTMMSPNAQIMDGTASNPVSNAEVIAGTNAETINFDNTAIDHSLSEVAKTFHIREYGNGAANGGTGAHQADVSMLSGTTDNIAYVMDDGLTSFNGYDMETNTSHPTAVMGSANGDGFYLTWIGTGITVDGLETLTSPLTLAQNLPYGTHFMRVEKTSGTDSYVAIDGIGGDRNEWPLTEINEVTFHQPKMPPIPEDACIIADYMLMADYVKQTTATFTGFSKGMRFIQASKDVFYNTPSGTLLFQPNSGNSPRPGATPHGVQGASGQVLTAKLPFFGTTAQGHGDRGTRTTTLNGTAKTVTNLQHGSQDKCDVHTLASGVDLGLVTVSEAQPSGAYVTTGFAVATPIHTSSHYQTFETPWLHELVGGDRNMEQHNLIVTPDGKSWDQVTRDTSYISNMRFQAASGATDMDSTQIYLPDDVRGQQGKRHLGNKDFAMAHDKLICLVDGIYCVGIRGYSNQIVSVEIKINGTLALQHNLGAGGGGSPFSPEVTVHLQRGDYIQWNSPYNGGHYGDWWVWKV